MLSWRRSLKRCSKARYVVYTSVLDLVHPPRALDPERMVTHVSRTSGFCVCILSRQVQRLLLRFLHKCAGAAVVSGRRGKGCSSCRGRRREGGADGGARQGDGQNIVRGPAFSRRRAWYRTPWPPRNVLTQHRQPASRKHWAIVTAQLSCLLSRLSFDAGPILAGSWRPRCIRAALKPAACALKMRCGVLPSSLRHRWCLPDLLAACPMTGQAKGHRSRRKHGDALKSPFKHAQEHLSPAQPHEGVLAGSVCCLSA